MKEERDKKITIDGLAAMMQKNFFATDKNIVEGFQKVNDRLDKVDGSLEKMEQELVNIKTLPSRVKKLEDALEID